MRPAVVQAIKIAQALDRCHRRQYEAIEPGPDEDRMSLSSSRTFEYFFAKSGTGMNLAHKAVDLIARFVARALSYDRAARAP